LELAAATLIVLGDKAGFDRLQLSAETLSNVAHLLSDCGRTNEAGEVVGFERRSMTGGARLNSAGVIRLSTDLASYGSGAEAIKFAMGINDQNGETSFGALVAIAQSSSSPTDAAEARRQAVALVKSHPGGKFFDRDERIRYFEMPKNDLLELALMCGRARDVQNFDDAATALTSRLDAAAGGQSDLKIRIKLARIAAAAGSAKYAALIDDAERRAGSDTDLSDQAVDFLRLAGARARAGDLPGTDRDLDRSAAAAKIDDYTRDSHQVELILAYADAHEFDRATAAMAALKDKSIMWLVEYLPYREADAGRYDDAWKEADNSSGRSRSELALYISVMQAAAGGSEEALKRLGGMSAADRCAIEIAVGSTLRDGKPPRSAIPAFSVADR
jgi:hypothetical protein